MSFQITSVFNSQYFQKYCPYFLIIFFSLLFNLFLLLNDQGAWDGWLISNLIDKNEWRYLLKIYNDIALPQTIAISYVQGFFDSAIQGSQFLNFVFITGSGCLILSIYKKLFPKSNISLALIGCILYVGFPNNIVFLYGMPHYSSAIFSYLLGLRLYLCDNKYFIKQLFGMILILYSFILESLIFYNVAMACLIPLIINSKLSLKNWKSHLILPKKYVILIISSLLYFITKKAFIKPAGVYNNYNEISWDLSSLYLSSKDLIENLSYRLIYFLNEILLNQNIIIVFILTFIIYGVFLRKINLLKPKSISKLCIVTLALFIAGALPYIAALKPVAKSGPGLRHGILLHLPIVLLLIILIEIIISLPFLIQNNKFKKLLYSFLISSMLVITTFEYSRVVSYNIHTKAQISALKKIAPLPKGTLFFVKSYRLNRKSYDVSLMLKEAWGTESWGAVIVNNSADFNYDKLYKARIIDTEFNAEKKYYGLSDFRPNGCWAKLEFWRLGNISLTQVLRYFFYRYTDNYDVNNYLKNYGKVNIYDFYCLKANQGEHNET